MMKFSVPPSTHHIAGYVSRSSKEEGSFANLRDSLVPSSCSLPTAGAPIYWNPISYSAPCMAIMESSSHETPQLVNLIQLMLGRSFSITAR